MRTLFTSAFLCLFYLSVSLISSHAQTSAVRLCNSEIQYGLNRSELEFDGEVRRYLIYVPASLNTETDVPLVLSLHGFTSNATQQMGFSQWNPIAEAHGFIVIYPQGAGFPSRGVQVSRL